MNDPNPTDYNPDLDPTPEDGKITPRDEIRIQLATWRALMEAGNIDDLNIWYLQQFTRFEELIRDGIEGDGNIFLPTPEPPPMPSGYDAQGFSNETSHNCVQHENFREMGALTEKSGNRILEYLGVAVLPHQWYLLPIDRFDGDEGFQLAYLKNATCTPHAPMIRGRSGFVNKPVYLNITEETVRVGGRELTRYRGFDPIPDHHQPITGTNMETLKANIEGLFLERFKLDGAGWEGYIRYSANRLFEMDRARLPKWERYQPPPAGLEVLRAVEINQARDQLKALQRHLD